MKKRVCFIDDADFEIELFTTAFGGTFELVTGHSLTECDRGIDDKWGSPPDLFVLDLYFPQQVVDQNRLTELKASPPAIVPDGGDLVLATQNYMALEKRLMDLLRALGQTPQGGLDLAQSIRESTKFRGVPMVFYSRNPTAEDYVRCMQEEGVLSLIPKPTGNTREETIAETRRLSDGLADKFSRAMTPAAAVEKKTLAIVARQAFELLLKPFVGELAKQGAVTLYKA